MATQSVKVTVDTLDNQARELSPTFIKVDVEGMEVDVLRGARETLARSMPALFVEIHGTNEASKRTRAEGVIRLLLDAGYRCLQVESRRWVEPGTPQWDGSGHVAAAPAAAGAGAGAIIS